MVYLELGSKEEWCLAFRDPSPWVSSSITEDRSSFSELELSPEILTDTPSGMLSRYSQVDSGGLVI